MDRLQNLVDHYDVKLQKLNAEYQSSQAKSNSPKRTDALMAKITRNEDKRNRHKAELERTTRDVNFDIADIVANRLRSSNLLLADITELYFLTIGLGES